jgi:hypothetical protein
LRAILCSGAIFTPSQSADRRRVPEARFRYG